MAILQLDKIIFQIPDTGIHCIHCGGDLKQAGKIKLSGRIIACITLGQVKIRHYQCDTCNKKHIVI